MHLTTHSELPDKASDRATLDIFELTPEMIDAGEHVLLCKFGGAVTVHWDARDLAREVFWAMRQLESALA